MSQTVDLDLDKVRPFRLTMFDARDACRYLSQLPGKGSVDCLRLIIMLGSRDWDAWGAVLSEGLKHGEPGGRLTADRALRYLQEAVSSGKSIAEIAKQVRRAGELGGVWETTDDEDARGNGSTPSSGSPSSM